MGKRRFFLPRRGQFDVFWGVLDKDGQRRSREGTAKGERNMPLGSAFPSCRIRLNCCMSGLAPSQMFGWVAVLVGLAGFVSAAIGNPEPTLTISLMGWGLVMMAVGTAILVLRRLF
jgi:hypothetical protein